MAGAAFGIVRSFSRFHLAFGVGVEFQQISHQFHPPIHMDYTFIHRFAFAIAAPQFASKGQGSILAVLGILNGHIVGENRGWDLVDLPGTSINDPSFASNPSTPSSSTNSSPFSDDDHMDVSQPAKAPPGFVQQYILDYKATKVASRAIHTMSNDLAARKRITILNNLAHQYTTIFLTDPTGSSAEAQDIHSRYYEALHIHDQYQQVAKHQLKFLNYCEVTHLQDLPNIIKDQDDDDYIIPDSDSASYQPSADNPNSLSIKCKGICFAFHLLLVYTYQLPAKKKQAKKTTSIGVDANKLIFVNTITPELVQITADYAADWADICRRLESMKDIV